ncbi:hypothetical protein LXM94_00270 [Rhizobium sp. TRM95111]|uniref:hypothetical protein n=1 Tax=Rhizobium alarense TaxID=2846851 RepID=UPI001F258D9B|nr:hypothetical protein [Rhizobium alarense]MCF3638402.1 hypothetical protein [Rhizobium alarense]
MLKHISHTGGVSDTEEILFSTPFGYMFPDLAASASCRLPEGQDTTRSLIALGAAMAADKGSGTGRKRKKDSRSSSFFTYSASS